jgi:hypothetical protein
LSTPAIREGIVDYLNLHGELASESLGAGVATALGALWPTKGKNQC